MNKFPRPEDALADRLRGMVASIKSLQNQVANLTARVRELEDREEEEGA